MADPLSAGISAGGAVLGSVINGLFGSAQAKKEREFNASEAQKNRDFQRDEREQTQQWELDMWNMNNEYNSIGSQIERARSAGVSPAAILGGDYKPAQSSAPTSTPMSGSAASTSSGGALGSAFINSTSGLVSAATNGVKALVDAKATDELLQYNKDHLKSLIDVNEKTVLDLVASVGVKDATRDNIEKATAWMDDLNAAEVNLKIQQATNFYNENFEIFQRILESRQKIEESESVVALNGQLVEESKQRVNESKANERLANSRAAYQELVNENAPDMLAAELTVEEVAALEAIKRKEFANMYNIPLGSSDFEFAWALELKGKYAEFCQKCITPSEQARWKPRDYAVDNKFQNFTNTEYFWNFDPRKGIVNPSPVDAVSPDEFWEDYYKSRARIPEIKRKYGKKYGNK